LYIDRLAPLPGLQPALHHLQYEVAWGQGHRSPTKWSSEEVFIVSYIILPLNVDTLLIWPVARIHCWSHDAEGKLPYIFNCKYALHLPGYYTQWNITYVL